MICAHDRLGVFPLFNLLLNCFCFYLDASFVLQVASNSHSVLGSDTGRW